MPLPKGAKVLGQKRMGNNLILFYKNKDGKIRADKRNCILNKKTNKFKCKKK